MKGERINVLKSPLPTIYRDGAREAIHPPHPSSPQAWGTSKPVGMQIDITMANLGRIILIDSGDTIIDEPLDETEKDFGRNIALFNGRLVLELLVDLPDWRSNQSSCFAILRKRWRRRSPYL